MFVAQIKIDFVSVPCSDDESEKRQQCCHVNLSNSHNTIHTVMIASKVFVLQGLVKTHNCACRY